MSNANLHRAKTAGFDEFYTQLETIEKELGHYEQYFVGKIVYCLCDDPDESQFVKFFRDIFKYLGLKELITTGGKSGQSVLFSRHNVETSWYKFYSNGNSSEGKCNGCDEQFPYRFIEVDHILSKSKGGTDHKKNCRYCVLTAASQRVL